MNVYDHCRLSGIPATLVEDEGHVMLPHFTGESIITAVGIGPSYRHEVKFLKQFKLVT